MLSKIELMQEIASIVPNKEEYLVDYLIITNIVYI